MIVAANLKTHFTRAHTKEYILQIDTFLKTNHTTNEVFVFPVQTALDSFDTDINIGAQNAYPTDKGAFTGEIGTQQLDEFGIKTILIGHSERRHVLNESQDLIAGKFKYFQKLGYKIIFCVGEPKEIREQGDVKMMEYLTSQLQGVDLGYKNLILAYEPVWSIGSGHLPSDKEITDVHAALRVTCKAPILYGGSVKPDNIKQITSLSNVDGVLIGGAALKADDFCSMISIAHCDA